MRERVSQSKKELVRIYEVVKERVSKETVSQGKSYIVKERVSEGKS